MYTFNNKLLRKLIQGSYSRPLISLKRKSNSQIIFDSHKSSSIGSYDKNKNKIKKSIDNINNSRSTNIYSYRHISQNNSSFFTNNNSKINLKKKILKYPTNNKSTINDSFNEQNKICNIINFKVFKRRENNKSKYIPQLKKEEELNNKICILPNYLNINNYKINSKKVINYLDLNEDSNNTFFISTNRFLKNKNFKNYYQKGKPPNKSDKSKITKKIQDIYPSFSNIEGVKNRKILYELNEEEKRNKKNEKKSSIYHKMNFELRKKMMKEKWKAEKHSKSNLSDLDYNRKLSLLSMKLYQRHIKLLNKKVSSKSSIDLPLYNLFLNLD